MNLSKLRTLYSPDNWKTFSEFLKWEMAVGGPDSHMATVIQMSKDEALDERIWRGFCYVGVYNVPSAEKIWQSWPYELAKDQPEKLDRWIHDFWPGLTTRRERKCVRSPDKMARYFMSVVDWMKRGAPGWMDPDSDWEDNYRMAWDDISTIYTMGRYVSIKFLEYGTRSCKFPISLPDLRPKDGWSPREALCLLFPEYDEQLAGEDSPDNLSVANQCAFLAIDRLREEFGVTAGLYQIQTGLCDWKQEWAGRRQFPGRSHDSEIMYHERIQKWWDTNYAMDIPSSMFRARYEIFPHEVLGELNGWNEVRAELGYVLRDYGYTWSDLIYKYHPGFDLSHPVSRDGAETNFPRLGQSTAGSVEVCSTPKVRRPARGFKFAGIKVHEIVPGLYQRGRFEKYPKEKKEKFLKESGINIVVSLISAVDDAEIYDYVGHYVHYPMADNKLSAGDANTLNILAKELANSIKNGSVALVHCNAGRNRSGLLSALILVHLRGYSGKLAIDTVREARPNALANETFVQYLEGLK